MDIRFFNVLMLLGLAFFYLETRKRTRAYNLQLQWNGSRWALALNHVLPIS